MQTNPNTVSTPNDLDSEYFNWLVDKAGGWDYLTLLHILHNTPFKWDVCNDSNREDDGAYMRWIFHEETGCSVPGNHSRGSGCSVLEMMVGMAESMHEFMYDPENGSCTQLWFQTFLYNLRLGYLTDEQFELDYDGSFLEVSIIINRFLNREYSKDGRGGMFPLPGTKSDVRKMELWYQMNEYCDRILREKFRDLEPAE